MYKAGRRKLNDCTSSAIAANAMLGGRPITHGSLFSGIGGFDLAAQWLNWTNVFQCEKNTFCQQLLKQNFKNVKLFNDIKEFDANEYEHKIDVISGGFPCQPFSVAGKRKGISDERFLWTEMLRIITEVKPKIVVGENVSGIINLALGQVLTDLEDADYTAETFVIPACAVNAPHRRDRVWIVAYANSIGQQDEQERHKQTNTNEKWNVATEKQVRNTKQCGLGKHGNNDAGEIITDTESTGLQSGIDGQGEKQFWGSRAGVIQFQKGWSFTKPGVCRRNDGVSDRVDRIEALGNAIVPQVAYEIFKIVNNVLTGVA